VGSQLSLPFLTPPVPRTTVAFKPAEKLRGSDASLGALLGKQSPSLHDAFAHASTSRITTAAIFVAVADCPSDADVGAV